MPKLGLKVAIRPPLKTLSYTRTSASHEMKDMVLQRTLHNYRQWEAFSGIRFFFFGSRDNRLSTLTQMISEDRPVFELFPACAKPTAIVASIPFTITITTTRRIVTRRTRSGWRVRSPLHYRSPHRKIYKRRFFDSREFFCWLLIMRLSILKTIKRRNCKLAWGTEYCSSLLAQIFTRAQPVWIGICPDEVIHSRTQVTLLFFSWLNAACPDQDSL